MRGALIAPVDVDVRGELLDTDVIALESAALCRQPHDGCGGPAADASVRMQLAARAVEQQRQVVGVHTEVQVERTRAAHRAVDGDGEISGAKAQLLESPFLAVLQDAAAACGRTSAQPARELAECDV